MIKGLERLQDFMNQTSEWSDKTFDNGIFSRERSVPISFHLQKEAKELNEALVEHYQVNDAKTFAAAKEELADCLTLVLDCATHFGCNADELLTACFNKLEKNKGRIWGKPDKNGVVEHIREYTPGDVVPYRNTKGNVKLAKISSFETVENGKIWFHGVDTVTGAKVWYPVHISQTLGTPNCDCLNPFCPICGKNIYE